MHVTRFRDTARKLSDSYVRTLNAGTKPGGLKTVRMSMRADLMAHHSNGRCLMGSQHGVCYRSLATGSTASDFL